MHAIFSEPLERPEEKGPGRPPDLPARGLVRCPRLRLRCADQGHRARSVAQEVVDLVTEEGTLSDRRSRALQNDQTGMAPGVIDECLFGDRCDADLRPDPRLEPLTELGHLADEV